MERTVWYGCDMLYTRLLPLLPALLLLAGCAPSPSEPGETTGAGRQPVAGTMRVALLTPGPVSDAGWNSLAYDGLQAIRAEGADVDNQQAGGTQIRDAFRTYAQRGYNLIIGHGFEYNEPAVEAAQMFPSTVFVTSSGGGTASNVAAFRFYIEDGFYLAGMMAALLSESGKVGSVAIAGIPSIDSSLTAFEAGAKAARPDVETRRVYFQTEGDVAAARQAAEELANAGYDFLIHQANAAAQGVFEACRTKGIKAFGSNLNQNDNETGVVVASAHIDAVPAFKSVADEVRRGTFEGRIIAMGMTEGAIQFTINPSFESQMPESIRTRLSEAAEGIRSGTVSVPRAQF
jgi:basic membrane protein A and related proteins